MRWFFLFVLALNLTYIGWYMLSEPATYAEVPPLKKDIDRIVLLSEKDVDEGGQQRAGEKARVQAEESEADETVAETVKEPVAQKKAAVKAAMPVKAPPAKTKKSESKPPAASGASVSSSPATDGDEHCFTLGPFRDLEALRSLTRDIRPYVVSVDFRGEEVEEQSTYWVFIKPSKTKEQAKKLAEKLKARKINDFYIINKGEQKYGLSLGRFRNKASAYGLAKKASKYGFDVVVEPIFKNTTLYWLDYQLGEDVSIPRSVFDKYIDSKTSDFTRKSRVCL